MRRSEKFLAALLGCSMLFGLGACNGVEDGAGNSNTDSQYSQSSGDEEKVTEKILLNKKSFTLFLKEETEQTARLEPRVYDGGVEIEGTQVSYIVEDPEVATVNADGEITPKGAGRTKVTAIYKNAKTIADVIVIDEAAEAQVNTFDEKYVNTYGRTYFKGDKLCLDYVGAGVGVAVNGTSLTANIEVDTILYLCVYVDGAEEYTRIQLTPKQKEYTLVSNMEEGFHTVRIVKSSEVYDGQIHLVAFSSEGFYTAPEKSNFRIEFVGDSITAGYGALGSPGDARTVENSDACSSYAYYAAQKLNVDYSMVAIQGICVKQNMWLTESMDDVYKLLSPLNRVEYDFADEADIVVLNLGTNDSSYITSKDFNYGERFPEDYLAFLRYIREKNPDAHVLCLYGFMGKQSSVDKGIDQAIAAMNDEKVVRVKDGFIANTFGANGHPSQEAQKEWGQTLADYIEVNIMNK